MHHGPPPRTCCFGGDGADGVRRRANNPAHADDPGAPNSAPVPARASGLLVSIYADMAANANITDVMTVRRSDVTLKA